MLRISYKISHLKLCLAQMTRYFFGFIFLFLFFAGIFTACQPKQKEKPRPQLEFPEQTAEDTRLNINTYIRYKKLHNWNDSLYFLVIGWGSDSVGSYSIMMADSVMGNYTSVSVHKQGSVVQSWINDFDRDSLPEIGIVTRSQNMRKTGQMRLHELGRNLAFETIDMQPLSEQLGADYEGGDIFYPQTGQIVREFRTLDFDTTTEENAIRRIIYELDNNQLIITEFENQEDEAEPSSAETIEDEQ